MNIFFSEFSGYELHVSSSILDGITISNWKTVPEANSYWAVQLNYQITDDNVKELINFG